MIAYFLPAIIALGIYTSYTDIRYGKIKNTAIFGAIIYSLFMHIFLLFVLEVGTNKDYIIHMTSNFIIALLAGFFLWDMKLWSSGDGKLFTAYSALIPILIYNQSSFVPYFPSLNLFINTFIPIFVFFAINVILMTHWKQKKDSIMNVLKIRDLAPQFISFFVFIWLLTFISEKWGMQLPYLIIIPILFTISLFSQSTLGQKHLLKIMGICSILILALSRKVYNLHFLKMLLVTFIIFIIFRLIFLDLSFQHFSRKIKISNLRQGMIPAEIIYESGTDKDKSGKNQDNRLRKKKLLFFSFFEYLANKNQKSIISCCTEGLSEKDIKKLRILRDKHPNFQYLRIQQSLPFAPFMFFGVLLTLLARGSIILLIRTL